MTTTRGLEREITQRLHDWESAGLLSAEQVRRIMAAEHAETAAPAAPARPDRGTPSVIEALAYVGGALIAAACAVLIGQLWQDAGPVPRTSLLGGLALALVIAGLVLPADRSRPAARLRAVVWAGAVVATGGAVGVVGDAAGWQPSDVLILAAATASVLAIGLWIRSRSVLQHAMTFAALATLAGAAADHLSVLPHQAAALGVWSFALAWIVWSRLGRTVPADPAVVLGCATAVFAAMTTMPVTWGAVLALGTAAGVVVLAVAGRSLPLLAVGAVGLFSTVPRAMMRLVPGSTGAALGLLTAGCLLVAGAVLTLRRQR